MQNILKISQAERRVQALRKFAALTQMKTGWIRYMRTILGMKLKALAKRSGVSLPTAAQSERKEAEGKVTLETLKKMANALECDFVYAFVPRKKIKSILHENAAAKAKQLLARADIHMALENQKVEGHLEERIERLAETLIQKGDVW